MGKESVKVYFRVAKNKKTGRIRVVATPTLNYHPLYKDPSFGRKKDPLPTVRFCVMINLPEDTFDFDRAIEDRIDITVSPQEIK